MSVRAWVSVCCAPGKRWYLFSILIVLISWCYVCTSSQHRIGFFFLFFFSFRFICSTRISVPDQMLNSHIKCETSQSTRMKRTTTTLKWPQRETCNPRRWKPHGIKNVEESNEMSAQHIEATNFTSIWSLFFLASSMGFTVLLVWFFLYNFPHVYMHAQTPRTIRNRPVAIECETNEVCTSNTNTYSSRLSTEENYIRKKWHYVNHMHAIIISSGNMIVVAVVVDAVVVVVDCVLQTNVH